MSKPEPIVIRATSLLWAAMVVILLGTAIGVGYWFGRGPTTRAPEAGVGADGADGAAGGAGGAIAAGGGSGDTGAGAAAPALATQPNSMPAAPAGPTLDLSAVAPDFGSEPPTEQIQFRPTMPESEPRGGGVCEHESTFAPRADAWHCVVDNQPYDPCYQVEGEDDLVICGAQPGFEDDGFLLRLVIPLSGNRAVEPPAEPWTVGIDNTTCDRILGMGMINAVTFGAKPLRYSCRDGTNLVDLVQDGATWAAQRVTLRFEGDRPAIDTAEWVPVRKAWR